MGKKQLPVLLERILGLADGSVIEVDTPEWQQWLDNSENRSFRFDDLADSYTCRKEKVRGQDGYWYAYRSVLGKTRSKYVGKTDSLTYEKLKAVDFDAATKLPKPLPSEVGNTVNYSVGNELGNVPGDDVRVMIEAIHQRLEALEKRLGKTDSLEASEASRQLPTELSNELPSSVGNEEVVRLLNEVAALKTERDILDQECDRLSQKVGDLDLEKQTLAEELRQARVELGELASLRTENEKLKQQLEDESHQRLRGEIRELEQKLSAKHKQMIDQRDKLWKEIKDLTEQRDTFERNYIHFGKELKELRESLPDEEVRSLPDAADLLNQLKGKMPKAKTGLKEIEAVLEILQSTPESPTPQTWQQKAEGFLEGLTNG